MNKAAACESALTAEVVIPGVPRRLFYSWKGGGENAVGTQVSVELGNRTAVGWIVRLLSADEAAAAVRREEEARPPSGQLELICKPRRELRLKGILAQTPGFLPRQLAVFEWMAGYYGCSLGEVLDTAIPAPKTPPRASTAESAVFQFQFETPSELTAGQLSALEQIEPALDAPSFSPFLLFGVTGSGKTEIYLRAISKVLARGESALVIVPEISLTPQLIDHFRARLDTPLGLLHSQISPAVKWQTWQQILAGEIRVVLGARSAVFAPLRSLSLIIVDEEHDASFKQSDSLRYHGRDVAVMRAKLESCVVILGSATPSFESLANVMQKRYRLLEMPERATTRPLPEIAIVDLRSLRKREMASANISPQLAQAIRETLAAKGQVMILYNRRGFSSYLQCDSCNEVVCCPNCSVALTYHKKRSRVLCHYCNYSLLAPRLCRFCRDPRMSRLTDEAPSDEEPGVLVHRGSGTERVFEELHELFPTAVVMRMDRDTVGEKDSYRKILGSMRSGQADILVGTQMIAKGHDLPGVTLVGIINTDIGLHVPDFRSSERMFQLITQAAGRAGRGKEQGRVIVQTREPNHPTIVATATGRFKAFARYEIEHRQKLGYPPAGRLMRIIISSTVPEQAAQSAEEIGTFLRQTIKEKGWETTEVSLLGPAAAPHEKLRGFYRHHLLVKANAARIISELAQELHDWKERLVAQKCRLAVDVDPVEML